jgi:hypothetical protein
MVLVGVKMLEQRFWWDSGGCKAGWYRALLTQYSWQSVGWTMSSAGRHHQPGNIISRMILNRTAQVRLAH